MAEINLLKKYPRSKRPIDERAAKWRKEDIAIASNLVKNILMEPGCKALWDIITLKDFKLKWSKISSNSESGEIRLWFSERTVSAFITHDKT